MRAALPGHKRAEQALERVGALPAPPQAAKELVRRARREQVRAQARPARRQEQQLRDRGIPAPQLIRQPILRPVLRRAE